MPLTHLEAVTEGVALGPLGVGHADGDFLDRQTVLLSQELHLGLQRKTSLGPERECLQSAPREHAEAALRVGDGDAGGQVGGQGEGALAPDAPTGNAAAHAEEARADDDIGGTRLDRGEQGGNLGRVVLAVGINEHDDGGLQLARPAQPGVDGLSFAEVVLVANDNRACLLRNGGGLVVRAVIHDDHLIHEVASLEHDAADEAVFVQRGDDRHARMGLGVSQVFHGLSGLWGCQMLTCRACSLF
ncbi:MAG: hypothetical protein M5U29_02120 [Anaerolineae bacterium]|nr:hypothetical protein [Anaerolineae bacterium]